METISCVEKLFKLKLSENTRSHIIIVCNGSKNGSDEIIENKYNDMKNTIVICSKENIGFARGNNLGYMYAKNQINCDFIVMMNSDVEIRTDCIDKLLQQAYKQFNFGVLGPDVLNLNGVHCNPVNNCPKTKKELYNMIKQAKRRLLYCKTGYEYIYCIYNRIKKKLKKSIEVNGTQIDCAIHGCCIILSQLYINRFNGLYDKTFLYGEEAILQYICLRENIKILYYPKIKVIHKEAVSTKSDFKSVLKRHSFYYRNLLESYRVFENLMDEY